jgi:DNA-binding NarL/FixJ family response regulator
MDSVLRRHFGERTMAGALLRVFIVEDSPLIRDRLLEDIGNDALVRVVGCADSEQDAVVSIEREHPDAVIVDISLRDGNGLGVIRQVRRKFPRQRLCIAVLTNYAYPDLRRKSMECGADYFFDKAEEYERVGELIHGLAAARAGSSPQ